MSIRHRLPMILTDVHTASVERLSPSFVRVELASPVLADFGVDGRLYDQRIKLVFPNQLGALPSFDRADESWFATWLDIPVEHRGHMRTYTVRQVRGSGEDARLVVDFVVHPHAGDAGPGSSWAASAQPGDRLIVLGPRRGQPFGGIEFMPGTADHLLLVGDETAVPAISSILSDLDADARGAVFLEVPESADVLRVSAPDRVEVTWLPRNGAERGVCQIAAVREYLGLPSAVELVDDHLVEPAVWETPTHSATGEQIASRRVGSGDLYAWIAGEAKIVTTLRRCLVNELAVDRRQVAFMGYWRRGVAMRS